MNVEEGRKGLLDERMNVVEKLGEKNRGFCRRRKCNF